MNLLISFFKNVDKKQCIEFGQLCVLVMLIFSLYSDKKIYVGLALIILLLGMIVPIIFYPFAAVWFTVAEKLSLLGSVIILSVVFFTIVVPVGLLRNLKGKDNFRLKQFKQEKLSVMITRDHVYVKEDLQHGF